MRILINALSGIGDALMFTPSLKLLYDKMPNYQIDMMVMFKPVQDLFQSSPYVKNVYFVDFLNQSKYKSYKQLKEIRSNDYFISINVYPSNRYEYNLVNYFIGANKRLGQKYLNSGFLSLEFLNNVSVKEVKDIHNVTQNVNLIRELFQIEDNEIGGLDVHLSEDNENCAVIWLKKQGVDMQKPIVGFHPGSSTLKNHINKRWDKEKYAALGKKLIEEFGATILLFGSEKELNDEINNSFNNKGVIASTSDYMDSMSRLRQCNLFISNDTAFLHSASAFKIPVVAIFGYTNYKELYPWQTDNAVIRKDYKCSPCFFNSPKPASCKWKGKDEFKCIKDIKFEEVYESCRKFLLNSKSPRLL
ncbi:MAG: glycosyltransferase family 9 protein [Ignavibacteriae bacterium]|nr:glycosyltransferase family 9 protein [Ignavibacteriota bacterium]